MSKRQRKKLMKKKIKKIGYVIQDDMRLPTYSSTFSHQFRSRGVNMIATTQSIEMLKNAYGPNNKRKIKRRKIIKR